MEKFTVNGREYRVVDGRVYDPDGHTAVLVADGDGGYDGCSGWSLGESDEMIYFPPLVQRILERKDGQMIYTSSSVYDPLRGFSNFPDGGITNYINVRWVGAGQKFHIHYYEDSEGWGSEELLIEDYMDWKKTRIID